ncbi:hypothetical protein OE88DRAFT_1737482 [Heliocybe sulcata]|uniref:G domain-containing protein n=1 Tax=Heliocybe sulcata TaxID=5364 RepID=A0A5C3N4K1_9AGAM|nr:hypothetical protein OE88DRAFT_1737482 [Heliocybe sulcata]
MASSNAPDAPHAASGGTPLKEEIRVKKQLLKDRARDLKRIPVPKMQEALQKMAAMLKTCKKAKNSDEAIRAFISRIDTLEQAIFQPILTEYRQATIGLTEGLTMGLHDLFDEVSKAISGNLPKSKLSPFNTVDVRAPLENVTSVMDEALDALTDKGRMKITLARVRSRSSSEVREQLDLCEPGDDIIGGPHDDGDLEPHVNEILKICPRFRILLLGRSGVGKSRLINRVFNIAEAEVSDYRAGSADIEKEFTSPQNSRFILHDSRGFEYGDESKLNDVKSFIRYRTRKGLKESKRLHAIWLCIAVPSGDERLLETGDEEILGMDVGDVPLIVVFTKYDLLITKAEDIADADWEPTNPKCRVSTLAYEEYQRICQQPLQEALMQFRDRPRARCLHRHISVEAHYDNLVLNLIRTTAEQVGTDVRATWAIAQRVDAEMSRDASIEIGRQTLSTTLYFKDKRLEKCLRALHFDTVTAWNFYDPDNCLRSSDVTKLLSAIVAELGDDDACTDPSADPNQALIGGLSQVGHAGMTVFGMSPAATAVLVPLAAVALLARWIFNVYAQMQVITASYTNLHLTDTCSPSSPSVLRCLMAYIIDINFVLWKLFWFMRKKGGVQPLTEVIVNDIMEVFNASEQKRRIHQAVRDFLQTSGPMARLKGDAVLREVVRLIKEFCQESA